MSVSSSANAAPVCSGRWQLSPITSTPLSVDALVSSIRCERGSVSSSQPWRLTSEDVVRICSLQPLSLALDGCTMDHGALEALARELGSATTSLRSLSLARCTIEPASATQLLWNAMLENVTLESVDVSDMHLTLQDADSLAKEVIPWNRSITQWNLSGNEGFGDQGTVAVVDAFVAAASSVQRLRLRKMGVQHALHHVLQALLNLTSLIQLDVALNSGYHNDPRVMDTMKLVDETLYRNCLLLHPACTVTHTALYESSPATGGDHAPALSVAALQDSQHQNERDVLTSPQASPLGARRSSLLKQKNTSPGATTHRDPLAAGSPANMQSPGNRRGSFFRPAAATAAAKPEHVQQDHQLEGNVEKRTFASPTKFLNRAASMRSKKPTVGTTTTHKIVRDNSSMGSAQGGGAVAIGDPSSSHSPASHAPAVTSAADQSVGFSEVSDLTNSVTHQSPPPRSGNEMSMATPHITPIRHGARSSSSPRTPHANAKTYFSLADVTEGAEEWRKNKEVYNAYIRSGASAGDAASSSRTAQSPSRLRALALQEPKYVMGKLISREKGKPTSAFRSGSVHVREPTPAERRRYAPWLAHSHSADDQAGSEQHKGTSTPRGASPSSAPARSFVGNRLIVFEESAVPGARTAIKIVDGGDVTYLDNDPRDIGYIARKAASGQAVLKPSVAFTSNTPRDCRWGSDSRSQLGRSAQAPPPGAYTVPSDFDLAKKKAQASARPVTATGRGLFGTTGSARTMSAVVETGVPGPGFYEIP